ncbi:MAG: hypothetical protein K2X11_11850, partial [Acetobacteraceae bacterium]|nr:hypothetical protein [Acetobacteraceae bacterium]
APDEEDAAPAAGAERDSAGKGREPALPAALEAELDAHRTLGLRAALAERPDLALRVLVHSMAGDAFGERWGEAVARFQPSAPAFAGNAALAGCPARRALEEAEATARASLPADRRDLWRWTGGQGTEALLRVLAVCVARGANGGSGDWPADGLHAAVAREAGLDMRRWWTAAEPEAFLARVPKAAVLAAVREGAGEEAARRVSGWKKAPMAAEAALLLGAAGWLPNRLRVPDAPANDGGTAEAAVAAE